MQQSKQSIKESRALTFKGYEALALALPLCPGCLIDYLEWGT